MTFFILFQSPLKLDTTPDTNMSQQIEIDTGRLTTNHLSNHHGLLAAAAAASAGLTTNAIFICFDPLSGKYCSLLLLPANPSSQSRTLEGLFLS